MTTFFTATEVSDEIKARLSTITIGQGAETDIGRTVFMGRRKIPADDEVPCTVVLEGLDDIEDTTGRNPSVIITQQYVIDGFTTCDPDQPNIAALAAIRDIKRAIFKGPDGDSWSRKVKKVRYLGRDIGPRSDGQAFVQVRVMIDVTYVEDLSNP